MTASTAGAQMQFVGDFQGHDYYLTDSIVTIFDARSQAAAIDADPARRAYVVAINSQAEQDFLNAMFPVATEDLWIGLSDEQSEGTWLWDSGEPFDFTFWIPGEPNNALGEEDWVHLDINRGILGGWNDNDCCNEPRRAIIEVEQAGIAGPVVYSNIDNPTAPGYWHTASLITLWEDVHIVGGGQLDGLTLITSSTRPDPVPGTLIEVSFRLMDAPDGGPLGTPLGTVTIDRRGTTYFGIEIIEIDGLSPFGVVLPNDAWIAVGLNFADANQGMGWRTFDPPTVGFSVDGYWRGSDPTRWDFGGDPVGNFGLELRVDACVVDMNGDGVLDYFDVGIFITYYSDGDPAADLNADGVIDCFDVFEFLVDYFVGCET